MKIILAHIGFLFTRLIFSQTSEYKVVGNCINENKRPTEYVNISLFHEGDSIFIKGALSDEKGFFEIDGLPEGSFFLKISGISLATYHGNSFKLSSENPVFSMNDVILQTGVNSLDVVAVIAEKQFIERKSDKLIVNVGNSIVSAGNTVLEVLQRSPGVTVNEESGISMKGKSGVVVMIDGKPTPLSGTDLNVYLKSIPAANLEAIELISNPSARYDAAGNAGIINIRFKKDLRQGLNGSGTAAYGQGVYSKPSASFNFNVREKKINSFGSYSYSQPQNFTYFYINRKFFDQNHQLSSNFEQETYSRQPFSAHNARIGVDLYATKKTVVGILLNGNWNENKRDGKTNALISDNNGRLDYTTQTSILLTENRFNGFGNFNVKHTFDSTGKEIAADIDVGEFSSLSSQKINSVNLSPVGTLLSDAQLATSQAGNISVRSFKTDYIHPFSGNGKIEAGLKSSLITSDNDVKFYNVSAGQNMLDSGRSNHFIYTEQINAAYVSYSKELKKWDIQSGLRAEHTNTKGEQKTSNEKFSRNYLSLFPNLLLNRKFKNDNSLSLSYARRIERPTYRQLNPFKIFVDAYTYVVGDPALKPVMNNVFELNHTLKGKYITTISYTKSKQSITDIFVQDDISKISYQVPANIRDFEQYNLGIYIPIKIKKILSTTLSGSVYRNIYTSPLQGGQLQQSFNSWDMYVNNVISLGTNGWSAELNAFYQSKMVWGLFYIKSLAQVTAGIQKVSTNKNSIFKINVSDIFLTNHIAVIVQYQNQDFVTERNWDSRVATLSYTYRFGKSTVTKARQRSSGVEEEKRRAG